MWLNIHSLATSQLKHPIPVFFAEVFGPRKAYSLHMQTTQGSLFPLFCPSLPSTLNLALRPCFLSFLRVSSSLVKPLEQRFGCFSLYLWLELNDLPCTLLSLQPF